jgi:hypothetical protein
MVIDVGANGGSKLGTENFKARIGPFPQSLKYLAFMLSPIWVALFEVNFITTILEFKEPESTTPNVAIFPVSIHS